MTRNWLAAVAGAIVLAVVLALFTTPHTASPYPRPALPPVAHANTGGYNMSAGQKIAIDPQTGQARPIEHDDVAPLTSSARQSSEMPQPTVDADGGLTVAIPDTSDVFTVATKGPDGKITIGHASGVAGANAKLREGSVQKKEVLNDR